MAGSLATSTMDPRGYFSVSQDLIPRVPPRCPPASILQDCFPFVQYICVLVSALYASHATVTSPCPARVRLLIPLSRVTQFGNTGTPIHSVPIRSTVTSDDAPLISSLIFYTRQLTSTPFPPPPSCQSLFPPLPVQQQVLPLTSDASRLRITLRERHYHRLNLPLQSRTQNWVNLQVTLTGMGTSALLTHPERDQLLSEGRRSGRGPADRASAAQPGSRWGAC